MERGIYRLLCLNNIGPSWTDVCVPKGKDLPNLPTHDEMFMMRKEKKERKNWNSTDKNKQWFCWVVVMGSLWEFICFVLRSLGAHDQQNQGYVIGSTLLILLAPLCKSPYLLTLQMIMAHQSFFLFVLFFWLGKRRF